MSTRLYQTPNGRFVDDQGRPTPAFLTFVSGLQDVSARVSAKVEPLPGTATMADIIAKLNEIIAALVAADLMEG